MKVPKFKSLKEEREFWDTHDSTDYHDHFKVTKNVVFVRPKKEVISLFWLDNHLIIYEECITLLTNRGYLENRKNLMGSRNR